MAFVHGKAAVFWYDDSGGTLRNMSTYIKNVNFSLTADSAETTTLSKNSKTFLAGLKNCTISVDGFFDSTASTGPDAVFWAAFGSSTTKTFEYGPEGGGSGAIKYSGESFVTSFTPGPADVSGAVPFSAQIQVTGDVTKGTFA